MSRYDRFRVRLEEYLDKEIESCKTNAIEGSPNTLETVKGQYIGFVTVRRKLNDLYAQIKKEELEDDG